MTHIIGIMAMIFGFISMAIQNYAGAYCCFGFAFILWVVFALEIKKGEKAMSQCTDCAKYNSCNEVFREIIDPAEKCNFFANKNVVTLTRCKKCKYFDSDINITLTVGSVRKRAGLCTRRAEKKEKISMLPDDFCSYGERS